MKEQLSKFSQDRRNLLKSMGILAGLALTKGTLLTACSQKEQQPSRNPFEKDYEYANGEEVSLNLFITSKEGVETTFKEEGIQLVSEKVVSIRKNLEAVDASSVKPIMVTSSIEQIAKECGLDSLDSPVRIIFIDPKLAVQGNQYKETQQAGGMTFYSKTGKRIIIVVSVGSAFEDSIKGRIAKGQTKVDPARLATDTMYHLGRIVSHEFYHAGNKHYLIDNNNQSLVQKTEKEATDYGNNFSDRLQAKQLPSPVVIQRFPIEPK